MENITRESLKLRYIISGQGEMDAEYKALARKLGLADKVIFTGYREDIAELCQAADLFVFPSLQEGLPMALMEAMAAKTPVICSDVRGNRELVKERELRFAPSDSREIAECIVKAFSGDSNMESGEAVENHYRTIQNYRKEAVLWKMSREYSAMEAH